MNLIDLVQRTPAPIPWSEGDNIPWNDPGFSKRMLAEHLTQNHDLASRRFEIIEKQIAWIHSKILGGKPTQVLDLACGPGLYASRLAALGHTCLGIDFSPASIDYGIEQAQAKQLACKYILQDIRQADFGRGAGQGYGLVLFTYGEPNVFSPADFRTILSKAYQAMSTDGVLLLEPHTFEAVKKLGTEAPGWWSSAGGLFSERPHVVLQENFWHEQDQAATMRYFVIDAQTSQVTRYASSMQAYTDENYRALLEEIGFIDVRFYPSLTGEKTHETESLLGITCRKG